MHESRKNIGFRLKAYWVQIPDLPALELWASHLTLLNIYSLKYYNNIYHLIWLMININVKLDNWFKGSSIEPVTIGTSTVMIIQVTLIVLSEFRF